MKCRYPRVVAGPTGLPETEARPAVDALQRLLDFEEVLEGVFRRFTDLDEADFDRAIDDALAAIGSFVGVDRAFVLDFDDESQRTWMTHEW